MIKERVMRKEIERMIKKGEEAIEAAEVLLKEGFSDQASGRAYYAVFHFMSAALLTKGLTHSKHSGVISEFSRYFIKNGIFPKEFAEEIRNLRRDREVGDYGYLVGINREEARDNLETAHKIIEKIKKYLQQELLETDQRP